MRIRFWRRVGATVPDADEAKRALKGLRRQTTALKRVRYLDEQQVADDLTRATYYGGG